MSYEQIRLYYPCYNMKTIRSEQMFFWNLNWGYMGINFCALIVPFILCSYNHILFPAYIECKVDHLWAIDSKQFSNARIDTKLFNGKT
jgi:hypothetical protein